MPKDANPKITHHGAVTGVTGSCHQYQTARTNALIDCGLFQGAESNRPLHAFDFAVPEVSALIVTHCHIDHVGRIPWLIAAGFRGPIVCTEPTAALLPLVLEDTLGAAIQSAHPGDTVRVNNQPIQMNGQTHRLSGFSAHADRTGLTNFCTDIPTTPTEIRLVHGDARVKREFKAHLANKLPNTKISIPT